MKSITIHNLDERASRKIEELAMKNGKSLNQTIKGLLYESLGLAHKPKNDFSEFLGIWSQKDVEEFNENINDLNEIDPEEWQ